MRASVLVPLFFLRFNLPDTNTITIIDTGTEEGAVNTSINDLRERVVLVSFIVAKDGTLGSITLEEGVDLSLNKGAMRLVLNMPKWVSGMHNGRQVCTRRELPITFRIQ